MNKQYNIYSCRDGQSKGELSTGRRENSKNSYCSFCDIDVNKSKSTFAEEESGQWNSATDKEGTFEVLFRHWLKEKSKRVRKSSLSIYRCYIESHLEPLLGKENTTTMTMEKLENLCDSGLRFQKNGKKELAVKSRIDLLRTLNNILRFGMKYGYMEHLIQLEYPKTEKSSIHVLREEELNRLEQCLQMDFPRREALGIYLCLYTGLRVGELCGLRWEDIDLEYGILYVRRTVQRILVSNASKKTEIMIGSPKSASSLREIPIPDHLLKILKKFKTGPDDAYFLSDTFKCFEPRRMQRAFSYYLEKVGLPHRGFHCTRHTFATRWVEMGADIKTLSEILGHTGIQITLDKYVHISEKIKRENINKIQPLCTEKALFLNHQNHLLIPSHINDLKQFVVNG